jgi:hypothetical protein
MRAHIRALEASRRASSSVSAQIAATQTATTGAGRRSEATKLSR